MDALQRITSPYWQLWDCSRPFVRTFGRVAPLSQSSSTFYFQFNFYPCFRWFCNINNKIETPFGFRSFFFFFVCGWIHMYYRLLCQDTTPKALRLKTQSFRGLNCLKQSESWILSNIWVNLKKGLLISGERNSYLDCIGSCTFHLHRKVSFFFFF